MKTLFVTYLFLPIFCLHAQQSVEMRGGEFKFQEESVCLTPEQRAEIFEHLEVNRDLLKQQGILPKMVSTLVHPMFAWPIKKNPDAPYGETWAISNFVDHNLAYPNLIQDWNCGNRSYDTQEGYNHAGVDIFLWPFSWYQFQNNQSWVIAAADGVILYKSDGNYDMNCAFNNSDWNAVYVQHADGSVAWYGHMKSGSLTTKSVGQTVSTGEYLGSVGSSGNSTGPHLHFEVYNSSNQLIDPYVGNCNPGETWWATQKPYFDTHINAVFTHGALVGFNPCPTTETTNFKNNFQIGDIVYAYIYLRDQVAGSSGLFELKRPNGTIAYQNTANFADTYSASYWYWSFGSNYINENGTWTVSFTLDGQTVTYPFTVGNMGVQDSNSDAFTIYPNPAKTSLFIQSSKNVKLEQVRIYNVEGKLVKNFKHVTAEIQLSNLPKGSYILEIESNGKNERHPFIKD